MARSKRTKQRVVYSRSDINKILDTIIHPWIKEYPWLTFVDGLLHTLNERNPKASLQKFIHCNLKPLIDGLEKELRKEIESQAREYLKK
jgi:hypothetical protein